MKCPHCEKKVSLFSKAVNSFSKTKFCPHCAKEVKTFLNLKIAAILFIPFILMSLLFLKPLFISYGLNDSIATGITAGLLVLLSMRLKKVS